MSEKSEKPAILRGMRNALKVEKRLDKNGRWVTRHVKYGENPVAGKKIPAVQLAEIPSKKKPFKPTEKQLKQTFYAIDYAQYSADPQLAKALGIHQEDTMGMHRFAANEVIVYDVLSTTSADNAIAIMGTGIRTQEEAQEKLRSLGLEHLIVDNSSLVDELLRRKISPIYYTETVAKNRAEGVSEKHIADAAEAHSVAAIRQWHNQFPPIADRILFDAISYDDIKTIGIGRLKKSCPTGFEAINALNTMHRGKARYDAEQLRDLINHTQGLAVSERESGYAYKMADDFGTDFVIGLKHFSDSADLYKRIHTAASKPDQMQKIVEYFDEMVESGSANTARRVPPVDILSLHEAGIPPEESIRGVEDGMTAQQIIAVHNEGISPSVSSGWL